MLTKISLVQGLIDTQTYNQWYQWYLVIKNSCQQNKPY